MSEIAAPVAFDVEIERKALSPSQKPNVIARLESWKSPETSKDDVENRINAANTRRDTALTGKVEKITERLTKVATNQNVLQSTHEQTLSAQAEALAKKLSTASTNHENTIATKVSKVASHNAKVSEAKTEVFSTHDQKTAELASTIDQKLSTASTNYEQTITTKVSKVASHNAKVSEAKTEVFSTHDQKTAELASTIDQKLNVAATNYEQNMAEKIMKTSTHNDEVKRAHTLVMSAEDEKTNKVMFTTASKIENATAARQALITDKVMAVGQQTREKSERGKQATAAKNERRVQIQTNLEAKTTAAVAKKDAILMERVQKSATKKRSPTNTGISADDITAKLDDAAARRDVLLMQRSEAAGHKNEKVKEVSNLVKRGDTPTRRVATPSKKFHSEEEPLPTGGESLVEDFGHEEEEEVAENDEVNESVNSDVGGGGCVIN
ncbi:hypothetical protein TL16_g10890 [Triparma laevis f. inornata]|uniref:Uncharacterized protein n=2 Tax=Triparma laevis TaxID=1534972 RepID=A0A9W7AKG9_9STRA|nr:hypothetical protein TrLO_g2907 [Triparma laevis f. longispina]GMH87543.1 hypothetical protein TL16_g10890 [Triparma laevis f. inornata]